MIVVVSDVEGLNKLCGHKFDFVAHLVSARTQCCAPPQASIPIKLGVRFSKCSRNTDRLINLFKTSAASGSTQCICITFLAMSMPTVVQSTLDPPVASEDLMIFQCG